MRSDLKQIRALARRLKPFCTCRATGGAPLPVGRPETCPGNIAVAILQLTDRLLRKPDRGCDGEAI